MIVPYSKIRLQRHSNNTDHPFTTLTRELRGHDKRKKFSQRDESWNKLRLHNTLSTTYANLIHIGLSCDPLRPWAVHHKVLYWEIHTAQSSEQAMAPTISMAENSWHWWVHIKGEYCKFFILNATARGRARSRKRANGQLLRYDLAVYSSCELLSRGTFDLRLWLLTVTVGGEIYHPLLKPDEGGNICSSNKVSGVATSFRSTKIQQRNKRMSEATEDPHVGLSNYFRLSKRKFGPRPIIETKVDFRCAKYSFHNKNSSVLTGKNGIMTSAS